MSPVITRLPRAGNLSRAADTETHRDDWRDRGSGLETLIPLRTWFRVSRVLDVLTQAACVRHLDAPVRRTVLPDHGMVLADDRLMVASSSLQEHHSPGTLTHPTPPQVRRTTSDLKVRRPSLGTTSRTVDVGRGLHGPGPLLLGHVDLQTAGETPLASCRG